jgi:hypothetical protein
MRHLADRLTARRTEARGRFEARFMPDGASSFDLDL